ncbi:hypothetical protein Tco_1333817 [Tanacetum coccineum]
MHNNIIEAGLRVCLPMLVTGRYARWQSRFMRYVDTKPKDDSLAVPERSVPEAFSNISLKNKAHYDAEAGAIHLILTRIGDDIYLTVDAYKITHDMWISIERLQQGESLNKQNQLEVDAMKVNVRFLQQLQPEWSRFYQKEVNEICPEKIARNANPLALVAAAQQYPDTYYQTPKPNKSYKPPSKQLYSTRYHASTRHKGKEIAKPITPLSESASEEDSDLKQAQRDKEMQKNLALIAKHFAKECKKPKRAKDYTYHKEKMLMCKQAEKGVPLRAE